MKHLLFVLSLLFTVSLFYSCSSNDEDETGELVSDLSGVTKYNESLQKWYISCYMEGTIDEMTNYYPVKMASQYEENNLEVVFSGFVLSPTPNNGKIGGLKEYNIKLTSIQKKL